MKNILLIFLLLSNWACTRMQTLNLKPHYYSERPSTIIWIQLAGFSDQHLPLQRFKTTDANYRTQLESADCLGKMWNYNLFELRPKADASFLSQITASKNMKGSCEDFSRKPIWTYLEDVGYKTLILENGANQEESLEKFLTCNEAQKNNLQNVTLVRMGPEIKEGVNSFHYLDPNTGGRIPPGLYYDKSCQKGLCFSTLLNNAQKIMANIPNVDNHNLYLLRDFSYLKALRKKDYSYAKEVLLDVEKLLMWVDAQGRKDILILITGAESLEIDFPKEGQEWSEYEQTGKNISTRNTSLLSSVFAKGPMSENFCGIFDETELLKRIMYKPEGKKFSWDALNPLSH